MANANTTLSRAKSKPELAALWLFEKAGNWRTLLAFVLIASLTVISITFNVSLGRLSGVDSISKILLPTGYALLDLSALFLSGYIGVNSCSMWRKLAAWLWFGFLLSLSLWAAASFTLAVDAKAHSKDLEHSIDQKRTELIALNGDVDLWRANVANTVNHRSRYQQTLEHIQSRQLMVSDELHALEQNLPKPTMAIYNMIAPLLSLTPETLNTIVRLLWAGALTLSPLVIMVLVSGDLGLKSPHKKRKLERETGREKITEETENSATQDFFSALVNPVKGHNGATPAEELNGLKYAKEWLREQPIGRVTRHKLGLVSKIKNREGVTKVIDALINQGLLERLSNGHLTKPKGFLRLIK